MGKSEIEAFLSHLAVDRKVAASTQNQAFNALLFSYRHVLEKEIGDNINAVRAQKPKRLSTILTKEETLKVIHALSGVHQLFENDLKDGYGQVYLPNALERKYPTAISILH